MEHPHTNKKLPPEETNLVISLMNSISDNYWRPLRKYLEENKEKFETFPALLLDPEHIVLYIGRTHLAIEYFGKEVSDTLPETEGTNVTHYDFADSKTNLFEEIIGFKFESTLGDFKLPLSPFTEDLVYPTNKGMDKLVELKWNWIAQDSIMSINAPPLYAPEGQFTRLINSRFFDADENGLKTRHIKWLDFIPLEIINETEKTHQLKLSIGELNYLVQNDAHYRYPLPPKEDYKYNKLPQINRFLELVGNKLTKEPKLTKFLDEKENRFILTMGILSTEIYSELNCEWQSEKKEAIKPDFFVVRPNGYADIVEFKLPNLKSKTIVGKSNRETFSAEINSYISQTRVYKDYFNDPNNRKWVEENHKIKVKHPKRILVVGRRWDFSSDDWKDIIDDYKDIEIMTFDDLTDGVVSQFYM